MAPSPSGSGTNSTGSRRTRSKPKKVNPTRPGDSSLSTASSLPDAGAVYSPSMDKKWHYPPLAPAPSGHGGQMGASSSLSHVSVGSAGLADYESTDGFLYVGDQTFFKAYPPASGHGLPTQHQTQIQAQPPTQPAYFPALPDPEFVVPAFASPGVGQPWQTNGPEANGMGFDYATTLSSFVPSGLPAGQIIPGYTDPSSCGGNINGFPSTGTTEMMLEAMALSDEHTRHLWPQSQTPTTAFQMHPVPAPTGYLPSQRHMPVTQSSIGHQESEDGSLTVSPKLLKNNPSPTPTPTPTTSTESIITAFLRDQGDAESGSIEQNQTHFVSSDRSKPRTRLPSARSQRRQLMRSVDSVFNGVEQGGKVKPEDGVTQSSIQVDAQTPTQKRARTPASPPTSGSSGGMNTRTKGSNISKRKLVHLQAKPDPKLSATAPGSTSLRSPSPTPDAVNVDRLGRRVAKQTQIQVQLIPPTPEPARKSQRLVQRGGVGDAMPASFPAPEFSMLSAGSAGDASVGTVGGRTRYGHAPPRSSSQSTSPDWSGSFASYDEESDHDSRWGKQSDYEDGGEDDDMPESRTRAGNKTKSGRATVKRSRTETASAATTSKRRFLSEGICAADEFLIARRQEGMSYREIRKAGGFTQAESTLRGRYRMLTKRPEERVRDPKWTAKDLYLLEKAVRKLARPVSKYLPNGDSNGEDENNKKVTKLADARIPWKLVAEYIIKHGGSYHFGNSTCRKKWDEVVEQQLQLGNDIDRPFFRDGGR
ncbi:hypothetical protein QBC47DRAFT_444648 [Echria macrotheca]|uniref:Myb-like domain-containing protein n=1 Tax=Echria macrotheca TaxID=438768 RepID=A0AAJ0FCC5_9PEZI|nr:hypothetical protein QBC47DRAFT_444648 [Echria macrotheca]